jgi:hypothetical protein
MRAFSTALMLTSGLHFVAVTAPAIALAQTPSPGPQPVPYGLSPVPYGQPPPAPSAAPVRAAAGGGDVIYLKNGGLLRGTIIDAIPNAQARIQLATGEIATVPWQEIDRIEQSAAKPATAATSAPAAAATAAPASTVWVHIDAADDVRLQQDRTSDDDWMTVCSAPCDIPLSTAYYYRIVGGGLKASGDFTLHAQPGQRETLDIHGASKGWFLVGVIAIPAGLLVGYVGLIVGAFGTLVSTASTASGQSSPGASDAAGVGWTMFGVGLAAAAGGLILVIANWKTSVTQEMGTPQVGLRLPDSWKRLPTWREATPEQKSLPQTIGVPIVTGQF